MHRMLASVLLAVFVSGFAAIGYGSLAAQEGRVKSVPLFARCAESAWRVEVLTVFGDKNIILEKLARHEGSMGLDHTRVFMFVVEAGDSADLAMFERTDGEHCNVTRGSVSSAGDLVEQILKQVKASSGKKCAGALTKALVEERAGKENLKSKTVPTPKSARDAIGETLEKHPKDFFRVTLFGLC